MEVTNVLSVLSGDYSNNLEVLQEVNAERTLGLYEVV